MTADAVLHALAIAVALTAAALTGASLAVGERRRLRRQLAEARHAAAHDPLTGLPNRAGLDAGFRARHRTGYTAVMLGLDGFKQINDTHGHATGDLVLCAIADRLTAATRAQQGFAARLAGDEFIALLPSQPGLPDRLTQLHAALTDQPVRLPGLDALHVGVSLGACRAPRGASPAVVKARADLAMYRAKRDGQPCAIYHPVLDGTLEHVEPRPPHRRRERARPTQGSRRPAPPAVDANAYQGKGFLS